MSIEDKNHPRASLRRAMRMAVGRVALRAVAAVAVTRTGPRWESARR